MENQDFLQLGTVNSSLPISGQQQGNLFSNDLLQLPEVNQNQPGSFSNQKEATLTDFQAKPVEYDQYLQEIGLGKFTSELRLPITNSESPTSSDNEDSLIGDVTSVNSEAVLTLAVATAKEQLESFASDKQFLDKMNLAFGDDWQPQAAEALIQDLASGEIIPDREILSAVDLKADGAFGEDTIYLSEKFLSENAANPEVVAGVLLEEIGHYVDQQLNSVDSPGDEGDIFSRLVQYETVSDAELAVLKAKDDSATIIFNGKEITVEQASPPEDEYLVGDWDGDGTDDIAVRRSNQILMDTTGDGNHDLEQVYGRGNAEDEYLVGDWDGNGTDNIAVRRGNQILMDTNSDSSHDLEQAYGRGNTEDEYLVGDWDGNGTDNIAVRRGNQILMDIDGDGSHDIEQVYGRGTTSFESTPYDATEIINSPAVEPEIREYAATSVPLILSEAQENGVTDPGQIAYILASADHESLLGRYMEEIASGEAYEGREDLGNTEPGDGPRFKGRGYVQITGRNNYTNWSERLGVDLVGNPELAAEPDIAATILVQGMRDGSFTGVGLSDYINGENQDFVNARRIVNGLDQAENIAQDAERYYEALT